jgi:glucosamine 6-phosphate synthetase-like amidotransferase/phosphosugar isomerase protein
MHVEDYMNETPACLLAMLTQTREDLWQAAKALTERGVTRIILTGSGTSYHGALTARSFMQQWCGLPVDVYWPFLLDDSALTLSDKALVIGISQGGGSLSTLAAMERARAAGHLTASSRYRPGGRFGLNSTLWRRAGWRQNQRVSLHHT